MAAGTGDRSKLLVYQDTEINKIDDEVTALWADSLQGETDSEKETQ